MNEFTFFGVGVLHEKGKLLLLIASAGRLGGDSEVVVAAAVTVLTCVQIVMLAYKFHGERL